MLAPFTPQFGYSTELKGPLHDRYQQSKALVFDLLRQPVDIDTLVGSVQGIEQASEVYLVSRLAIDVDHPAERAYLDALAHRLNLPGELVAHLDHQMEA